MEKDIMLLMNQTVHRPFPMPAKKWMMFQVWKDVVFLHTRIDPSSIEQYIPPGLTPDLFDGSAWLSFVIFNTPVSRLRPFGNMNLIPPFCELNLRTYVQHQGRPGIHFIHIKANRHMPVLFNKMFSLLPYQYAHIQCSNQNRRYFMDELSGKNLVDVDFLPDKKIVTKSEQDKWLTERYVAWQLNNNKLYSYHIHHDPWDLYSVKPRYNVVRYQQPQLLLNHFDDLLIQYSPIQKALLWQKELSK